LLQSGEIQFIDEINVFFRFALL